MSNVAYFVVVEDLSGSVVNSPFSIEFFSQEKHLAIAFAKSLASHFITRVIEAPCVFDSSKIDIDSLRLCTWVINGNRCMLPLKHEGEHKC